MNRKETAWKKSRKFGDIKGGRRRPKMADNIFSRRHSLLPPAEGEDRPVYFQDNPSKDFFYPVTIEEIKAVIARLPPKHTEYLTHIWLRKNDKKDYEKGKTYQGCFVCGSGVHLIVLYAFPVDLKMRFGKRKPLKKELKFYGNFSAELGQDEKGWYLQWSASEIKNYYLNSLLLHEIGHHVDFIYYHYWSNASRKRDEAFADDYAVFWSSKSVDIYD